MADCCPVCKIEGDHKLSCPRREDGQLRFSTSLTPQSRAPQMPALPPPDTHYYDEDAGKDVWSHSAGQMHAFRAEGVREALERGFQAGWIAVARDWAMRDDLIEDIGSPAYIADRDPAIAEIQPPQKPDTNGTA